MIDDQLRGKWTRNWPALFAAAVIALTACQVQAPETPGKAMTTSELKTYARAWFTSPTCSRPCWDGLLPGTSMIEDAYTAAARNSYTERTWTDPPGEWAWKFRGDPITIVVDYALSGRSTISQTAVALEYGYRPVSDSAHPGEWRYMTFERFRPVEESPLVTVGEVFAKLGPPEYVAAWIYTDRTGPNHFLVYVFASAGVAITVDEIPGTVPDVGPGAVVARVAFFVPGLENYLAMRGFPRSPFSPSAPPMPWSGFKAFVAYCQNVAPTTTPCDVKPR